MKTKGIVFSAVLLSTVTITPFMAQSVTLGSAQKTPCLFGALGTRTQCQTPQTVEKMRLDITPKSSRSAAETAGVSAVSNTSETSTANEPKAFTEGTAPSETIQQTEVEEAEDDGVPEGEEVATVPLPFGGVLLLSSLGLMLFANRKNS